jgi:hypothetical protein
VIGGLFVGVRGVAFRPRFPQFHRKNGTHSFQSLLQNREWPNDVSPKKTALNGSNCGLFGERSLTKILLQKEGVELVSVDFVGAKNCVSFECEGTVAMVRYKGPGTLFGTPNRFVSRPRFLRCRGTLIAGRLICNPLKSAAYD